MPRLVAYGCSFTYGYGLSDCTRRNDQPGWKPSKLSYVSLLADKMQLSCVNRSKPGSSNKEIWKKIMSSKHEPDDVIIIGWSFAERTMFKGKQFLVSNERKDVQLYYDRLYSSKDHNEDFALRVDHINSIHKCYNVCVDKRDLRRLSTWMTSKFLNVMWEDAEKLYPRARDGNHPVELAHKHYAETLHQCIVNEDYYKRPWRLI